MISFFKISYSASGFLNYANAFMTYNSSIRYRWNISFHNMKISAADSGFENFHDLLAHIIGWWEEGARIITGIVNNPGFTWESHDTDTFNEELTEKYSTWSDDDLFKHYESVRLAMMDLTANLPDDFFLNKDIEDWLAADVVEHYDEHSVPA